MSTAIDMVITCARVQAASTDFNHIRLGECVECGEPTNGCGLGVVCPACALRRITQSC